MNRRCNKCQLDKLTTDFYRGRGKDGLHVWCRACCSDYSKSKYPIRKKDIAERSKQWKRKNAMKFKAYLNTPEMKLKRRLWKRKWDRKAMEDPMHRLSNNLRGNMYHALRAMKGFRKWEALVGYTIGELASHLESHFSGDMSWENYGSHWQVDHVIPKSWFKYDDTDDPQFKECWALKNLQPKLKIENILKGNRFMG